MRIWQPCPTGLCLLAILLGCASGAAEFNGPAPAVTQNAPAAARLELTLPNRADSLKFAVLGDFGNGSRRQSELADTMALVRSRFPFELVITVGDNLYGNDNANSIRRRFEIPYKALLDAGVKFYASLGNHDTPEFQRYYELFNMGGQLYYSFKAPRQDVRFFALQSEYMTVEQIGWVQKQMTESGEAWKIPYFHHPLYSSGERHGSNLPLRRILEPIFLEHGVTVVFAGHDHFYERTTPQHGIVHFVVGSGGQLRRGNIDERSGITAKGFDTDLAFLVAEIDGDELFFDAISRTGEVVDSGAIRRREKTAQEAAYAGPPPSSRARTRPASSARPAHR